LIKDDELYCNICGIYIKTDRITRNIDYRLFHEQQIKTNRVKQEFDESIDDEVFQMKRQL
jgi:transcription initiation factor TFIIIB Brf1 subunit/transcription initiation factor TFIIB